MPSARPIGRTSGKLSSIGSPLADTRSTTPPLDVNTQRSPCQRVSSAQPRSEGTVARLCLHEIEPLGWVAARRVVGRIHPMDHPVAPVRLEQRVAALGALAVQHDHQLAVLDLLRPVGAGVPDRHHSRPVAAVGNVALEGEVLERVVLGVHGEVVAPGVPGETSGQGPRHQDSLVLEAQVPVQPGGVVLLDHEPPLLALGDGGSTRRLGRAFEVALAGVLAEPAI